MAEVCHILISTPPSAGQEDTGGREGGWLNKDMFNSESQPDRWKKNISCLWLIFRSLRNMLLLDCTVSLEDPFHMGMSECWSYHFLSLESNHNEDASIHLTPAASSQALPTCCVFKVNTVLAFSVCLSVCLTYFHSLFFLSVSIQHLSV